MTTPTSLVTHELGRGTVDVRLPSDAVQVGEPTDVNVRFTGRNARETIARVDLALDTLYRTGAGYRRTSIETLTLATDLGIGSTVTEKRTASVTISYDTPPTLGTIDVIGTFEFVTDRRTETVETYLDVLPTRRLRSAFLAMFDLGFTIVDFDCVADDSSGELPYVVTLEYRSTEGPFDRSTDTVELFVRQAPDELEVFAAVDRDDADEPIEVHRLADARTTIRQADERAVRDRLQEVLERAVHR